MNQEAKADRPAVRRFELSADGSHKFWQLELEGESFTVRYGRIGTKGQSRKKELASAELASAEAAKLIRQKTRKGYVEVPSPGSKSVSEPAIDWTAEMRAATLPRRDHPGAAAEPASRTQLWQQITARLRKIEPEFRRGLAKTDPDLRPHVEAVFDRASLDEPPTEPAAIEVEAMHLRLSFGDRRGYLHTYDALLDFWITSWGFPLALRAVVAGASLEIADRHTIAPSVHPGPFEYGSAIQRGFLAPWLRLRSRLAAADEDAWQEARQAAELLRGDASLDDRIGLAFAFPDHPAWAEEELRQAATLKNGALVALATAAADADVVLDAFGQRRFALDVLMTAAPSIIAITSTTAAVSMLAANGAAVTPIIAASLALADDRKKRRRLAEVLERVKHADAVAALVEHIEDRNVGPSARAALKRHPELALEVLASAATGRGQAAEQARGLLARHLKRGKLADHLETLPTAERATVEALLSAQAPPQDEAPAEALPSILATPPWLAPRPPQASLPRVDAEVPTFAEGLDWRDGEREAWSELTPQGWAGGAIETAETVLFLPVTVARLQEMLEDKPDAARNAVRRGARTHRNALARDDVKYPYRLQDLLHIPHAIRRLLLLEYEPQAFEYFYDDPAAERLVAEHGLDALDLLLGLATGGTLPKILRALGPYRSPRVAPLMVDALAKKTGREGALAWLERQGEAAAAGILPLAAGARGKQRELAIEALHIVARQIGHAPILELADAGGESLGAVTRSILAIDPRQRFPKSIPEMPEFWQPATFTRPLLNDGRALPIKAVEHLGAMLAFTRHDVPYAGLLDVREACQPASLAAFAWDLTSAWIAASMPPKHDWALHALGHLGDDDSARRLVPLLRAWPADGGHRRAVSGLEVLANIGSDIALMHLNNLGRTLPFKALKAKAQEKIRRIAERRNLSPEELGDRLVPKLGLDADGSMRLDFGPRQFRVGFDEHLKPYVRAADGKKRKALPKPAKSDDAELAQSAAERFKTLKKDVRTIASSERARLEQAMCRQRRWSADEFRRFLAEHPLLGHLVRRLVWATFEDNALSDVFRVTEDGTLADLADETWELPPDAVVGLPHPLELSPEQRSTGSLLLADYEVIQPIAQLGRDIYTLEDGEPETSELRRWHGRRLVAVKLRGLEKNGWRRGQGDAFDVSHHYERTVASTDGLLHVVLDFEPGFHLDEPDEEQTLGELYLSGRADRGKEARPFSQLNAITMSEIIRDLEDLLRVKA